MQTDTEFLEQDTNTASLFRSSVHKVMSRENQFQALASGLKTTLFATTLWVTTILAGTGVAQTTAPHVTLTAQNPTAPATAIPVPPAGAAEASGELIQTNPAAPAPVETLQPNRTIIPPSTTSTPFENAYLLGPGDQVQMDIFDVPELSSATTGSYVVLIDGTIRLPGVGGVRVQGLSLDQASNAIARAYAPYIRDPMVTLKLASARTLRVSVAGEVKRPGAYVVSPASQTNAPLTADGGTAAGGATTAANQWPTVSQAIQSAGGITQFADLRKVQVRRPQPDGSLELIDVNLWDLIRQGNLNQDIRLRDQDSIVIPTAVALDNNEAILQGSANLSPASVPINVVGEVGNPGTVQVPPNTPLNQALMSAGGFDQTRARRSRVELIRLNPDGTASRRTIKVDLAAGINEETNPSLREYDTIVVSRSGATRTAETITTILSPFTGILGALGSLFGIFD